MSDKVWFVYKTTNKNSGLFYVGVHKGYVSDNYLGSGTWLKRAIKSEGRESFFREIIKVCESDEDAYELEELIVDQDFISRLDTYNLALGGRGDTGRYPTTESRLRMCKPKSDQHRLAISAGKTGKKLSEEHRLACARGRVGRKVSEETKLKMRESRLRYLEKLKLGEI